MNEFTEEQIKRYSRHIILQEVGGEGQQKLLSSKVLCIGAGGLGSPIIQYLAAAGVGTIGIVDDDVVELSNLQRQVIHGGNSGIPKVESAKYFVKKLNPDVDVITHNERINPDNISDIINDYDIVVDGSDNFATRYLVNDACVLGKKPLSHGSIFRFEGYVTTILPDEGPCYRCLFEHAPPAGMVPSCQEAGVIGVLPGIIGVIQATEVVKYLLGLGDLLVGRMIYYDALNMSFDEIKIRKNPSCPVCGQNSKIKSIKYENYQDTQLCTY
ncbi:HesA/MoeB/ThiF family protein [Methanohalophilus mahii]|uniref:UBA/THIF-type NAD/FAD binding protein n=1 Tax=Methanohalophilus mahii (strain ATCC 35705 / DSM 5219 / SLP) TaxID=547558 RepID=D5EAN2_METMS|nr:molybdopterin-synthase adenylyltransferase MoeB [Methanohalophilus mahii]ADE36233.1 UBA/THIF-type NAD/FAD binding protein [Methanohalophilus mahii DSM 5219]